jgi:hypothetical protein
MVKELLAAGCDGAAGSQRGLQDQNLCADQLVRHPSARIPRH